MTPHVAQHELFIRAAREGRRDHVYQACLFDPLTAATMPPDRIVEMCDELIAAHGFAKDGGVLPDLDVKRTLVPASGKTFGRVDAKALRASWDAQQKRCEGDFLTEWHVVGPFHGTSKGRVNLDVPTPVRDGEAPDLASSYRLNGHVLRWQRVSAGSKGYVDLAGALGYADWSVAYAYAEIESVHGRETVLRCGSDDGIRIWLNGEQVHSREVGRAYRPNDDEVAVYLRPGTNRLFVKIDNYQGGWGFGVSIPPATF
jgi:hypothetical protein